MWRDENTSNKEQGSKEENGFRREYAKKMIQQPARSSIFVEEHTPAIFPCELDLETSVAFMT